MDWMKPTLDEDEDEEDEDDEGEDEEDEDEGKDKNEGKDEGKGKGRDKDKQEEIQSAIATLAKKTFEETLRQMNVAMTGLLLLKPNHKERVIELTRKPTHLHHQVSTSEPPMKIPYIVPVSIEEEAIAAVRLTDFIIHRAISMIDEQSNVSLRKHTFDPVEMLSGSKIPFFDFLSHNSTMIEAKSSESTRTHSLPIVRARDTYNRKIMLGENELHQVLYEMYVTLVQEGERARRAVLTDGTHWVFILVLRDTENSQEGSYIYGSKSIPTENRDWATEYVLDNGVADCIAGIVAYWVLHSHDGDITEDDWFELLDFNSKPSEPST
ncbi:hypothetical protein VNI00_008132 [Paramarasmius palmivorus]|uniref:Uncharacterized protein n=1 Tax=Paramarasmius palmivorus TaxID=297713 RepID=A0AAW0CYP4_9AGAR